MAAVRVGRTKNRYAWAGVRPCRRMISLNFTLSGSSPPR